MWKVTWNKFWGTRFQNTFVTLYFSRKPTKKEIIKAFHTKEHYVSENYDLPHCSGMITISRVEVEF